MFLGSLLLDRFSLLLVTVSTAAMKSPALRSDESRTYEKGETLELQVNKLTSLDTVVPVDYYSLPFCQADEFVQRKIGIGQILGGDRVYTSYKIHMTRDVYCKPMCASNFGSDLSTLIREGYRTNWILDDLPSASRMEDEATITTRFFGGVPLGFVGGDDIAYIYNHLNFIITYEPLESKYLVSRFVVQPLSIQHDVKVINTTDEFACNVRDNKHTDWENTVGKGRIPQKAEGTVVFTIDVLWRKLDRNNYWDSRWASRWDVYLTNNDSFATERHTRTVITALIVLVAFLALLARKLKKDLALYKRFSEESEYETDTAGTTEEPGWKLIHKDVFRPPSFSPLFLSVFCGSGAQLLSATLGFATLWFLGVVSQTHRGQLLLVQLLCFAFSGPVNGLITSVFFKTFHGKEWRRATVLSASLFPAACYCVFFTTTCISRTKHGTMGASPFAHMFLLFLWLCVSAPLVLLGSYLGYKRAPIQYPISVSSEEPREIPPGPFYLSFPFVLFLGVALVFKLWNFDIYVILCCIWEGYYYPVPRLLLPMMVLLLLMCSVGSVLWTYLQLCRQNHRWWWTSFCIPASVSIYMLFLSWYMRFERTSGPLSTRQVTYSVSYQGIGGGGLGYIIYVQFSLLISFGVFLMTGFVGMFSSLWFTRRLYASVRMEDVVFMGVDAELSSLVASHRNG